MQTNTQNMLKILIIQPPFEKMLAPDLQRSIYLTPGLIFCGDTDTLRPYVKPHLLDSAVMIYRLWIVLADQVLEMSIVMKKPEGKNL